MLAFALISLAYAASCSSEALPFVVSYNKTVGPFNHFWEGCVGSGHATLALRADYQALIKQAHDDCGFQQVRFHAVLDDDMSTYLGPQAGVDMYSFFNIDQIYDYLLSIGMRPYVELSFMPDLLASGNQTVMHYKGNITPPKNWTAWSDLISALASHLVDRYGIDEVSQWNFEVWNEPNGEGFWTGGMDGYFMLYNVTANAIKSVDQRLRVGGPATMQSGWINEFLTFVQQNDLPIDFVSTHEYPTDPNCGTRDCMSQITQVTRDNVTAIYGSSMPLYYSEFNDGLGSNPPYHDTPYASAFLFKNMYDINGIVDIMSWWTFSDIFEEPGFLSQPFGAVTQWGLLNIYGIPKPSYRAFQLLHGAGDTLLAVSPNVDYYPTVGVWATLGKHKELQVWAYNTNLPGAPINNETLCITLSDIEAKHVEITRIDSTHGNAPQLWYEMGQPMYPTDKQNQEMYEASKIYAEKLTPVFLGNGVTVISFSLEPQGVAYISVK